jgi:hypothetical protein
MPAPKEYRNITQQEGRDKYTNGNWAQKRAGWPQHLCEERPSGNFKSFWRYWDEERWTWLYLREYRNPTGTEVVVHEIREDDIFYTLETHPRSQASIHQTD